jgi:hypothetical protein
MFACLVAVFVSWSFTAKSEIVCSIDILSASVSFLQETLILLLLVLA